MSNGTLSGKQIAVIVGIILSVAGGGTGVVSLRSQQGTSDSLVSVRDSLEKCQDSTIQNAKDIIAMKADIAAIKEDVAKIDTMQQDITEMKVMQREILRAIRGGNP